MPCRSSALDISQFSIPRRLSSFVRPAKRLEKSFKVVKTDDEIYIKDNISEKEMIKKFKEEFCEELVILKLKDFNRF